MSGWKLIEKHKYLCADTISEFAKKFGPFKGRTLSNDEIKKRLEWVEGTGVIFVMFEKRLDNGER